MLVNPQIVHPQVTILCQSCGNDQKATKILCQPAQDLALLKPLSWKGLVQASSRWKWERSPLGLIIVKQDQPLILIIVIEDQHLSLIFVKEDQGLLG